MQCHVCGTEVRPEHKFCMECGARLRRPAGELALAPPTADDEETNRLPALAAPSSHPMFDPATGQLLAIPPPPPLPPPDEDATNVLPAVGAPMGRGGFGPPDVSAQGPGRWDHPSDTGPLWPGEAAYYPDEPAPTTTMQPPYRAEYDGGYYDATGRVPATYAPWEVAPWEQGEAPKPARTFRVKPLLVISVLAAAAAVVGMVVQILDIDWHGHARSRRGVEAQRLRHQPHRRRHPHGADDGPRGDRLVRRVPLGRRARRRCRRRPSPGGSPSPSGRPSWSSAQPSRRRRAARR